MNGVTKLVTPATQTVLTAFAVARSMAVLTLWLAAAALVQSETISPTTGVIGGAGAAGFALAAVLGQPVSFTRLSGLVSSRRAVRVGVILVAGALGAALAQVLGSAIDTPPPLVVLIGVAVVSAGLVGTARILLAASLALLFLAAVHRDTHAGVLIAWVGSAVVSLGAEQHARLGLGDVDARSTVDWHVGRRFGGVSAAGPLVGLAALAAALGLVFHAVLPPADLHANESLSRSKAAGQISSDDAPAFSFSDRVDTSERFVPGNDIVLRITAARPELWRGQAFDHWDGSTWTSTSIARPLRETTQRVHVPPGPGDVEGGLLTVQRVEVVRGWTDVIVAANRLDAVAVHGESGFGHRYVGALWDGSVQTVPLPEGTTYTVESRRPEVTPELLRRADPLDEPLAPHLRRYLQLPSGQSPRIAALAEQILGSHNSTYDKVVALQTWMGANTTYTLDIPELAPGSDSVEQFLFVDKRGFCQQIASSLAVLLRTQGVPTRFATGFAPGLWNPREGAFDERESDAHAWVEVWFPGVGWQGFDPTAQVPLSGQAWTAPAMASQDRSDVLAVVAGAVVLGVFGVLAVTTARSWVRRRRGRSAWSVLWSRIEREGARRGRPRQMDETPRAYIDSLVTSVLPDRRLVEVGRAIERRLFERPAVSDSADGPVTDRARAVAALHAFGKVVADHPRARWLSSRRLARTGRQAAPTGWNVRDTP